MKVVPSWTRSRQLDAENYTEISTVEGVVLGSIVLSFLLHRPSSQVLKCTVAISLPMILFIAPVMLTLLELSNYPGTIDDTQLGFSGAIIRSHFALMSSDEISLFILANTLDYVFLISFGLLLFSSILMVGRRFEATSVCRRVICWASLLGAVYLTCDGIENMFLFAMAANPLDFPDWLAIGHSSLAVTKFLVMYLALGWLALSAIALLAVKIRNRIKAGRGLAVLDS